VNQDNTVEIAHRALQIEKTPWRNTLAGCRVTVYEHLDGTLSVGYGPHVMGRFNAQGLPLFEPSPPQRRQKAVEKTGATPLGKRCALPTFPPLRRRRGVYLELGKRTLHVLQKPDIC
jgi:hypothetical protein